MAQLIDERTRQLLEAARRGDGEARAQFFAAYYETLRARARRMRGVGASGATLQPTAIVHELFLQMERRFPEFKNATDLEIHRKMGWLMRGIVREAWRRKNRPKNGGGAVHQPFEDGTGQSSGSQLEMVIATDLLDQLRDVSEELADAIILCAVLGMSHEEAAAAAGVTATELKRRLREARNVLWRLARSSERTCSAYRIGDRA